MCAPPTPSEDELLLSRSPQQPTKPLRSRERGHAKHVAAWAIFAPLLAQQAAKCSAGSALEWSLMLCAAPRLVLLLGCAVVLLIPLVWWNRDDVLDHLQALSRALWGAAEYLQPAQVDPTLFFSRQNRRLSFEMMTSNTCPNERTLTLSVPDPFLSKETISAMTLHDIGDVFLYVSQVNQVSFDREAFLQSTPTREVVKHAIHAVDCAVLRSRGPNTVPPKGKANHSEEMDALTFCAAMRIYAEWRSLRGIPGGYPKFGFGMNMARRDLIQNLKKIEQAVHDMLDAQQKTLDDQNDSTKRDDNKSPEATAPKKLVCPTLRQLLQHEIDSSCHPNLPKVFEHSAGSGVLWTVRQICYQSLTLENNTRVPVDFPTPKAAFNAAYESVYGKYHGFLTRTMFQSTIEAAPPAEVVTRHMNAPYILEAVKEDIDMWPSALVATDNDDDNDDDEASDLTEEEVNSNITPRPRTVSREADDGFEEENGVELGDKIAQIFSAVFAPCLVAEGDKPQEEQECNLVSSIHSVACSKAAEMAIERNDVPYYLSVLRPLEQGWDSMISDLNMNDPSRV